MADQYPESGLTPNLGLSLEGQAVNIADNFIVLDGLFPGGPPPAGSAVPVISQRLQVLNATTPQSVALTVASTQMVALSMYLSSAGLGAAGHEVVATIDYTCELGPEVITVTLPTDARTIIMETYPLLCIAGTTVTLSTAYAGGATNDPYNLDVRLVQMP